MDKISRIAEIAVRAAHLPQEREDCLQEALVRFWQVVRTSPGEPPGAFLRYCHCFIQDVLRHGRSLDSPKRRWLGCSLDSSQSCPSPSPLAGFIAHTDPLQEASANDDLAQIRARLTANDQMILMLLLEGNAAREVARRLSISPSGVGKSKLRIQSAAARIGLCPKFRRPPGTTKK